MTADDIDKVLDDLMAAGYDEWPQTIEQIDFDPDSDRSLVERVDADEEDEE